MKINVVKLITAGFTVGHYRSSYLICDESVLLLDLLQCLPWLKMVLLFVTHPSLTAECLPQSSIQQLQSPPLFCWVSACATFSGFIQYSTLTVSYWRRKTSWVQLRAASSFVWCWWSRCRRRRAFSGPYRTGRTPQSCWSRCAVCYYYHDSPCFLDHVPSLKNSWPPSFFHLSSFYPDCQFSCF